MHIAERQTRRAEVDGESSSSPALRRRLLRAMVPLRAHHMEEERRLLRGTVAALAWDVGWMSIAGGVELAGAFLQLLRRLAQEQVVQNEREANADLALAAGPWRH